VFRMRVTAISCVGAVMLTLSVVACGTPASPATNETKAGETTSQPADAEVFSCPVSQEDANRIIRSSAQLTPSDGKQDAELECTYQNAGDTRTINVARFPDNDPLGAFQAGGGAQSNGSRPRPDLGANVYELVNPIPDLDLLRVSIIYPFADGKYQSRIATATSTNLKHVSRAAIERSADAVYRAASR
jgi:hypothetical protein